MTLSDTATWGLLLADVLLAAVAIIVALVGVLGFIFSRAWVKSMVTDLTIKETRKVLDEANIDRLIKERVDLEAQSLYGDLVSSPDHPDYQSPGHSDNREREAND